MNNQPGVRASWYLLALIPLGIGAIYTVFAVRGLFDAVEQMPRVVVPGKGDIPLQAGDYVAYGETQSQFHGIAYLTTSLQLRCGLRAADSGEAVALTSPSASTRYSLGAFGGQSMFALTVPRAGTYELTCEGQGGPATIAFGTGLGAGIVTLLAGPFGGVIGALVIAFLVRRRRRRARVANELAARAPAPL
jgi:hypothetical protein